MVEIELMTWLSAFILEMGDIYYNIIYIYIMYYIQYKCVEKGCSVSIQIIQVARIGKGIHYRAWWL
jgi:hypothetical protein